MRVGTIILIISVIALLGGFSGLGGWSLLRRRQFLYGVQPPVPIIGLPACEAFPLGDVPYASLDHGVGHIIESRIQVRSGRSFGQARR